MRLPSDLDLDGALEPRRAPTNQEQLIDNPRVSPFTKRFCNRDGYVSKLATSREAPDFDASNLPAQSAFSSAMYAAPSFANAIQTE
jgi:hypothetical protein